ncbi:hypothetical protein LTR10_009399 [Elasticomyces elasticus]|nr:hypothetical protein LTR10_009399 [Elasticomyces elasticus]KAK4971502.1 hypothetical protein LTR42_007230 [Elasticomyces elasticus]
MSRNVRAKPPGTYPPSSASSTSSSATLTGPEGTRDDVNPDLKDSLSIDSSQHEVLTPATTTPSSPAASMRDGYILAPQYANVSNGGETTPSFSPQISPADATASPSIAGNTMLGSMTDEQALAAQQIDALGAADAYPQLAHVTSQFQQLAASLGGSEARLHSFLHETSRLRALETSSVAIAAIDIVRAGALKMVSEFSSVAGRHEESEATSTMSQHQDRAPMSSAPTDDDLQEQSAAAIRVEENTATPLRLNLPKWIAAVRRAHRKDSLATYTRLRSNMPMLRHIATQLQNGSTIDELALKDVDETIVVLCKAAIHSGQCDAFYRELYWWSTIARVLGTIASGHILLRIVDEYEPFVLAAEDQAREACNAVGMH